MRNSIDIKKLASQHGIDIFVADVQHVAGAKMVTAISSDYKHFDSMIASNSKKVSSVAYSVVNRVIGMANRAELG